MTAEGSSGDRTSHSRRTVLKAGGVAIAAGLAGCAGGGGDGGGGGGTTAGDGGGGDGGGDGGATTGTMSGGEVTVEFWPAWGGYYEETFNTMVSNFEDEYSDINVEMSAQGSYAESRNALFNAANAGNPPDVGHLDKGNAIVASDSGFFTPVEEVWPDINPDDYLGPAMGTSIVEGTIWSVPFNNSQIILYYNKDHFEQAGLDPESPPQTLEELSSMANTIVDEGVADKGVSWPNHSWWITSWLSEMEQFTCNEQNGRAGEPTEVFFDSDPARDIFDWWVNDLGDAYHNPGIENWGASEQAFQNGVSAMHMNSTGSIAYSLSGFRENDINVGVAGLPVPGERIGHSMGGAAVWVSDKDRSEAERQAVATFLQNMTGPEQQALYHRETGYFPSHTESLTMLEDNGWFDDHPDTYAVARQQLDAWEEHPMNQGILMGPAAEIYDEVARQSGEMLQGKSIDDGVTDLTEFGNRRLERYERA